ncbi:CYTH and CHAD domain-containing protein [Kozakia baliensis]|uniref:CYTH and CHAD domain-containing protein n=1 Tax=Kozakia baliensis TaxID=153496 RepID=UPI00055B2959|nr:CYTH and CHAD domain-containing protein [Kozakia baliensis]
MKGSHPFSGSGGKAMSGKNTTLPLEIELKLLFPPEARPQLDRYIASLDTLGQSEQRHLVTTYYDTPDLALNHAGLALRIRRSGHERIQTLKSSEQEKRLASHRGEWEWPVKSDQPELTLLADTPAAALTEALDGNLAPVWVSDVHRTSHTIQHDDAAVELAVDEGAVRAGDAQDTIREIELELKAGPVTALYGLALSLQNEIPLRIGTLTKAERGHYLQSGTPRSSEKVDIPKLTRKTTLAKGLKTLLGAGLNALIRNQPAAEAEDAEGIHQMRVAIRQLRTILHLLNGYTDRHTLDLFQSELRRIGRELGEARDWDVFCLETLPKAFETPDENDPIRMLHDDAAEKRTNAHRQLRLELEKTALTTLVLSLTVWIENPAFAKDEALLTSPLSDIAPILLDRLAHKVMRRGRHIRELSAKERHDLRKSLKKLRYGASYFAKLYPTQAVKTYMKHCKKLQLQLGEINDAAVATTLIGSLSEAHLNLAPAASAFSNWNDERLQQALDSLPAAWKGFRNTKPFWH